MNNQSDNSVIIIGKKMKEWMNITCESFAGEFKDPTISEAFREMWVPEFSMLFMLFTFAYLHNKNAGYPIGGSMPMSKALESRFRDLGGELNYRSKVTEILTENNVATGIRLEAGIIMKPIPQSLPDLKNFYMCGQWVEPGGGLPTGVMSGLRLVKTLCREDRKKFKRG